MPDYRSYPLLGSARVAALRRDFAAKSDAEALDHVKRLVRGYKIEVWQGARRVGSVRGSRDDPPA